MRGSDPGECIVCGAMHCSCGGGPIVVEQLPATAARRIGVPSVPSGETPPAAPLVAEIVQATLPPNHFTSGTYRRRKKV